MIDVNDLLKLVDAYVAASGTKEVTLSFWVFNDSKKIAKMREGADVTVGKFNEAVRWFSTNWPAGAVWPAGIDRPAPAEAAE